MSALWTRLDLPEPVLTIATLGGRIALGMASGEVLHSADGGSTWTAGATSPAPATALLPLSEAVLVGMTSGVGRAHAVGGWQPGRGIPLSVTVTSLAGRGTTVIAGTHRAGVFRSVDGGARWGPVGEGLPHGRQLDIHAAAAGPRGFVVAHALGVSRSGDGGRTWTSADVGLPFQLPRVALAADGRMLYVGVGGRLYGAAVLPPSAVLSWVEAYDGPGLGRPLDLLGSDAGVLFAAVPDPPHLLHSADGGTTWRGVGAGLAAPPAALAVVDSRVLAVLPDGALWRTARPPRPSFSAGLRLAVEGNMAGGTVVTFTLDASVEVALTVHDVLDREVGCLLRGEVGPGVHRVLLPARAFEPGLYRCRLRAAERSAAAAFVLAGQRGGSPTIQQVAKAQ